MASCIIISFITKQFCFLPYTCHYYYEFFNAPPPHITWRCFWTHFMSSTQTLKPHFQLGEPKHCLKPSSLEIWRHIKYFTFIMNLESPTSQHDLIRPSTIQYPYCAQWKPKISIRSTSPYSSNYKSNSYSGVQCIINHCVLTIVKVHAM